MEAILSKNPGGYYFVKTWATGEVVLLDENIFEIRALANKQGFNIVEENIREVKYGAFIPRSKPSTRVVEAFKQLRSKRGS